MGQIRINLIRHAQTAGNLEKRYIGKTDEDLCEEGLDCVTQRRSALLPFILPDKEKERAILVSSPMKRCLQTARCILGDGELYSRIRVEQDLRECDFGRFENRNYIEMADDPDYQRWVDSNASLPFPDGESKEGFSARTCECFERLLEGLFGKEGQEEGDSPAVLTLFVHGGTIMTLMERFALPPRSDYEWMVPNAGGYSGILKRRDHSWIIESEERI